jgi:hypothetical protein
LAKRDDSAKGILLAGPEFVFASDNAAQFFIRDARMSTGRPSHFHEPGLALSRFGRNDVSFGVQFWL